MKYFHRYYRATILDDEEGDLVIYNCGRGTPSFSYWIVPGTHG